MDAAQKQIRYQIEDQTLAHVFHQIHIAQSCT